MRITTLYVTAGACSFGTHLVVEEFDLPVEVKHTRLREPDAIIHRINPLGRVPSLLTADGELITENVAVLSWLGDLSKNYSAFATPHTLERAQIQSWLAFFSSEVHAGAFRLLNRAKTWSTEPVAQQEFARIGRAQLSIAFAHIDQALVGKRWLVGDRFTIADAYLGVFLSWALRDPELLKGFSQLAQFIERYNALESVRVVRAREAEWAATSAPVSA
ncbi:MAG: glutathione binding-like protein [Cellvibrio sp.]